MEQRVAVEQEPAVEEIARETGQEAAVVAHLGYEDVAVVETTRKMWKKVMEISLADLVEEDLVEEDLVAVHVCQTDLEEKDLVAEVVVAAEVAEEVSVEDNVVLLQSPIHGTKVPNILP
jgi:RNA-binding protein YhbY